MSSACKKKLFAYRPTGPTTVEAYASKQVRQQRPSDPKAIENGVRQALADKVSGNLVGLWLLLAEHLRLGTWELLCGWCRQPGEGVWPRLALQLVQESALCLTGLRDARGLRQRGFELANGLPFLASDVAIHQLLNGHTIEEAKNLQSALGRRRLARRHFGSRVLIIDPHRILSFSRRQMRRHKKGQGAPVKVAQTFFCLDADTRQPVALLTGTSARTVTHATPEVLDLAAAVFGNSDQIRHWLKEAFGVWYTSSGIKQLLKRIGASYHKVTGFLWKADPDKQHEFVAHYERQKAAARRPGARRTRRYFVDACHPLWGLELVYACWLLVGQRFLAGMGSGRKRLNILGAYCPDDQEYLDLRLTRDNINGEQFVNLLRLLRAAHPETERFVLYLDRAKYYGSPVVKAWLRRHPGFQLEPLPTYSPNLNLIERLWKFLRKKALSRWHPSFEAMQEAVSEVLDHMENYRTELETLLVEKFHIVARRLAVSPEQGRVPARPRAPH